MKFDEETFEKTFRLWAGIIFSGVPVQSRRVWRGFGDDNATRFDEETVFVRLFLRSVCSMNVGDAFDNFQGCARLCA
jgi:hypothetical protein